MCVHACVCMYVFLLPMLSISSGVIWRALDFIGLA